MQGLQLFLPVTITPSRQGDAHEIADVTFRAGVKGMAGTVGAVPCQAHHFLSVLAGSNRTSRSLGKFAEDPAQIPASLGGCHHEKLFSGALVLVLPNQTQVSGHDWSDTPLRQRLLTN